MNPAGLYAAQANALKPESKESETEKSKKSFFSKIFGNLFSRSRNDTSPKKEELKEQKEDFSKQLVSPDDLVSKKQQPDDKQKKKKNKVSVVKIIIVATLVLVAVIFGKEFIKNYLKASKQNITSTSFSKENTNADKTNSVNTNSMFTKISPPVEQKNNTLAEPTIERAKESASKMSTDQQDKTSAIIDANTEESNLFKQFCNVNKQNIANNILFMLDSDFEFVYMGKKYRQGDVLSGISRDNLKIGVVFFSSLTMKTIKIDGPNGNSCEVNAPWNQGLAIETFFDALDVTEKFSGKKITIMPGETFSYVELISATEKIAELKTPLGIVKISKDGRLYE